MNQPDDRGLWPSNATEIRVALVTGAAAGIGYGIAEALVVEGWAVVMLDRADGLAAAAERLDPAGVRAVPVHGDVTRAEDLDRAVRTAQSMGRLELAVANAAISAPNLPLVDLEEADFDRVVDVNLRGVFLTCKHAGAVLRRQQSGSLIIMSSVMWQAPQPGEAVYGATKAAGIGLMQSLALDLAPYDVRVNAIAPGRTRTEMNRANTIRRARQGGVPDSEIERADAREIPLGRLGEPSDVAAAVSFLASPSAAYITGQVINVNGGLALHF